MWKIHLKKKSGASGILVIKIGANIIFKTKKTYNLIKDIFFFLNHRIRFDLTAKCVQNNFIVNNLLITYV